MLGRGYQGVAAETVIKVQQPIGILMPLPLASMLDPGVVAIEKNCCRA
jgi:hypothetical protein